MSTVVCSLPTLVPRHAGVHVQANICLDQTAVHSWNNKLRQLHPHCWYHTPAKLTMPNFNFINTLRGWYVVTWEIFRVSCFKQSILPPTYLRGNHCMLLVWVGQECRGIDIQCITTAGLLLHCEGDPVDSLQVLSSQLYARLKQEC